MVAEYDDGVAGRQRWELRGPILRLAGKIGIHARGFPCDRDFRRCVAGDEHVSL
jgi:hypothetical protein